MDEEHILFHTHLEQRIQEYLSQRLWHSKVSVTGADLKGGLQTLYGNCSRGRGKIICEQLNNRRGSPNAVPVTLHETPCVLAWALIMCESPGWGGAQCNGPPVPSRLSCSSEFKAPQCVWSRRNCTIAYARRFSTAMLTRSLRNETKESRHFLIKVNIDTNNNKTGELNYWSTLSCECGRLATLLGTQSSSIHSFYSN